MKPRDLIDLVCLAALWGASFLFMRIAAPEFGPIPLIELRVAVASLVLAPLLAAKSGFAPLFRQWRPVAMVGLLNTALPFCLIAFSTLHLTGGLAAILNATSPLWGALIAWVWIGQRPSASSGIGLTLGFAGVALLVQDKLGAGMRGPVLAVGAALLGAFLYGIAAGYTKRRLAQTKPLVIAAGSQLAAAIILLPAAVMVWPQHLVSAAAWWAAIIMGMASTALAYVLYFRLIANVGPAKAIAVTFLVPMFAMLWGALFIDESITATMLAGCAVILTGTALAIGAVSLPGSRNV